MTGSYELQANIQTRVKVAITKVILLSYFPPTSKIATCHIIFIIGNKLHYLILIEVHTIGTFCGSKEMSSDRAVM